MSVASVVPGSDILYLSQQLPSKNVQVESVLTTVDGNGLCKIGLRNVSALPVKLKSGVLLYLSQRISRF